MFFHNSFLNPLSSVFSYSSDLSLHFLSLLELISPFSNISSSSTSSFCNQFRGCLLDSTPNGDITRTKRAQKSLKIICFSPQVSSDEDVAIFQRQVKSETVGNEEKELDESLTEDLWADVFQGGSSLSSNEGGRGSPVLNSRTGLVQHSIV